MKEQEKLKILKEKRNKINEVYSETNEPVEFSQLTFRDKIYLGALLRTALSEDMEKIIPLNEIEIDLAPTSKYEYRIIKYLIDKRLIVVNPNSKIEAFVDTNEEEKIKFPYFYYIYEVIYNVNIGSEDNKKFILSSIMNPAELKDSDKEEALDIWKEIALQECLQYFKYEMENVRFDFNVGDKTIATFVDLLKSFSVSQIYGIIYKSVANATKYYQESSISRLQAANSVIGGCQRYAERAKLNNWELSRYSRIKDLPQSIISEIFFNRILGIGDLGFNNMPTEL